MTSLPSVFLFHGQILPFDVLCGILVAFGPSLKLDWTWSCWCLCWLVEDFPLPVGDAEKSVVLESLSAQDASCCVCHRLFELKGTFEVIGPNLPPKAGRLSKNVLASGHRVLTFKGSLGGQRLCWFLFVGKEIESWIWNGSPACRWQS